MQKRPTFSYLPKEIRKVFKVKATALYDEVIRANIEGRFDDAARHAKALTDLTLELDKFRLPWYKRWF